MDFESYMNKLKEEFNDSGKHTILVVDDLEDNVMVLRSFLKHHKYNTLAAHNGIEAIEVAEEKLPDLILLDLNMPGLSGIEVLKKIRLNESLNHIGIILLTASGNVEELLKSFAVGADDFIQKPYHHVEMLARIQSVLKMRDTQMQLLQVNKRLDQFNRNLEKTVATQVDELEKTARLRRYFSPQVADKFMSDDDAVFKNKRQEITVVFLDLRNFTSFAERHEPEEVMEALSHFHHTIGPVIFKHDATLERFTGDGLMCFLGAPNPIEDHAQKSFTMAQEMMESIKELSAIWEEKGFGLSLGIGISTGMASTGTIGFEQRLDYAAIGSVTNLSARLCGCAAGGEIVISKDTYEKLLDKSPLQYRGAFAIKGFKQEIETYSFIS
jgi:adenylate cyclase